jgi:hypothetical protein
VGSDDAGFQYAGDVDYAVLPASKIAKVQVLLEDMVGLCKAKVNVLLSVLICPCRLTTTVGRCRQSVEVERKERYNVAY